MEFSKLIMFFLPSVISLLELGLQIRLGELYMVCIFNPPQDPFMPIQE